MITLTDKAIERLSALHKEVPNGFKISVNAGGCAGFSYELAPITEIYEDDIKMEYPFPFYIDGASVMYITGMTIDYKEDLMGSHFLFENPMASSSCGCGTSFGV